MEQLNPLTGFTTVEADFDQIEESSNHILEHLSDQGVMTGYGLMGCVLTIGRLAADRPLSPEEEVKFMQAAMEFVSVYWSGGKES